MPTLPTSPGPAATLYHRRPYEQDLLGSDDADAISTGVGTRALDRLYTGGGASGIALQYDDTPLEGFVDALDEVVYAAALARFGADVSEALAELEVIPADIFFAKNAQRPD